MENDKKFLKEKFFPQKVSQRFYEKKTSKISDAKKLGFKVGEILKKKSNNSYKK